MAIPSATLQVSSFPLGTRSFFATSWITAAAPRQTSTTFSSVNGGTSRPSITSIPPTRTPQIPSHHLFPRSLALKISFGVFFGSLLMIWAFLKVCKRLRRVCRRRRAVLRDLVDRDEGITLQEMQAVGPPLERSFPESGSEGVAPPLQLGPQSSSTEMVPPLQIELNEESDSDSDIVIYSRY